ncbi:MAG: H-NS family nucleoid-associated regulatory protein [Burkholderiaceae bacterium]
MDELELLHKQIADLQKKAEDVAVKRKEPVIEEIKAKIKLYGITAKELGFGAHKVAASAKTSTVAVKYKQGENTWTGRGRQPKFIVDHLATGAKIEDLLVK